MLGKSNLSEAIRTAPSLESLVPQRPEFARVQEIWTQALEPALASREGERRRVIRKAVARTIAGGLVPVLALAALVLATDLSIAGAAFPAVFFGMVISVALIAGFDWLKVFTMKSRTKELILSAACEPFGFSYSTLHPDLSDVDSFKTLAARMEELMGQYAGSKAGDTREFRTPFGPVKISAFESGGMPPPTPAYETLRAAGLLPGHASRKFEDLIVGERAGAKFALVEAHLESGGKNNTTMFQGLLVHVEYPERFLGRTLMARSGWWKRGRNAGELQKVALVSRELEEAFTVYSTDQVEARALLTPDRMERLIALERHFSGAKLRGVFEDGHMTIALEADDKFEAGSIFEPLVDPRRFSSALAELGLVCDLIDGFLTRDWVKGRL